MRNQFFSMIAVAAFLFTIGGTVAAKSVQAPTMWFYLDEDGHPEEPGVENPDCSLAEPICAAEYTVDEAGNPQTPTGLTKSGIRR